MIVFNVELVRLSSVIKHLNAGDECKSATESLSIKHAPFYHDHRIVQGRQHCRRLACCETRKSVYDEHLYAMVAIRASAKIQGSLQCYAITTL